MDSLQHILNENDCSVDSVSRIECYDISHIQGTNTVASMVVFVQGEKESSQYRKFKIRLDKTPDDFASMSEVLERRLKHTEWDLPGLLIVDGGKGQVSAALEVLEKNKIHIPLIGLAKREETIVIPKKGSNGTNEPQGTKGKTYVSLNSSFNEVSLPKNSKALLLLMRIRDEAHRFAITYHRKLRSKTAVK
jgi:excinuclease ABC subunit C